MNASELREVLRACGLSQRGAAKALDVHERTMRRYCASAGEIPRVIEYAVRYMQREALDLQSRGNAMGYSL